MNNSLYSDLDRYCDYSDPLKLKPESPYAMEHNYNNPANNIITEDGVYSMVGAAPLTFDEPAHMAGYQDSAPLMGYSDPVSNNEMLTGLSSQVPNLSSHLPQELAEMVSTLLIDGNDDFPPFNDFDQADLDLNIAAADDQWNAYEDLDPFGNPAGACGFESPNYETMSAMSSPSPIPASLSPAQETRRRKPRKAKTAATNFIAEVVSPVPSPHMSYDLYPNPDDISGAPSPASSSDYSDGFSATEEGQKQRQRRPRVSYSTLTEEEKYKRIRDLNNEASRHYRDRQRKTFVTFEKQLPGLQERNQHLKGKVAALEKLRDQMKQYSHAFLNQNMPDNQNMPGNGAF